MGLTVAQLEEDGYLDGFFKGGKNKEVTPEILSIVYPKASKRKKTDLDFMKKAEEYTLNIQKIFFKLVFI